MTHPNDTALRDQLKRRLGRAGRIGVVGIGDELKPEDRPGMAAARHLQGLHLPHIAVFLSGTVPESFTGPLRKFHPDHILLFDAADMDAAPGTFGIVRPGQIVAGLFSTHVIPLWVLMNYLEKDTGARVTLIGIQPDSSGAPTKEYTETFYRNMKILQNILQNAVLKRL